jgi:antitoxin (DNA-binding transcriptional repressor) of toxin-antitoxin stability system
MMTYTIQEAERKFEEILWKIRAGERILLVDEIGDLAEIRPIAKRALSVDPVEDALRELEEEGILSSPAVRPEGEITPIAFVPGALARFLASRD